MKITLFIIAFSLISLLGCNTTNPPDNGGGNGQDTTSHNFTWQTFQFGQHSSSVLYDVAIIDENNIYAVGEIYLNDSLGQADLEPYNLARWDGQKWDLNKIYYLQNGSTFINPIRSAASINLLKNNNVALTIILGNKDTTIYIDSLLPNKTYTFQAALPPVNQYITKSNEVEAQTLDTTSHNINWQVETIGDFGSYALDVAVINENDIWLVGQFYERFGSDTVYNAAHWNGSKWELILIPVKAFGGHFSKAPLRSIFYIQNELWVIGDAGGYSRLKNGTWFTDFNDAASAATNKISGTSSNNLFFVGSNGSITHYDGNNFTKMESGTEVYLKDVYGTPDGKEVWACGWNDSDGNSVILKLNENKWEKIYERNSLTNNFPYNSFISTLWIGDNKEFFLTGIANGIVKHSILDTRIARKDLFNMQNFAYRIRGNAVNDIFLAGDIAMVWHFNGQSWKQYTELLNQDDRLYSMEVRENNIVIVGERFVNILAKALVIRGKK